MADGGSEQRGRPMGDVRDGLSAGKEIASLTRRRILQGAGAFLGTTVIPVSKEAPAANLPLQGSRKPASADITGRLAEYMGQARDQNVPADVTPEGQHH